MDHASFISDPQRLLGGQTDPHHAEGHISKHEIALSLFVITSALIAVTIVFEFVKDRLIASTRDTTREILMAMFSEMTVLGFLSVVTFVIESQSELLDTWSELLFGHEDGHALFLLFEEVHMGLFMIMILFLLFILFIVRISILVEEEWEEEESNILQGVSDDMYNFALKEHRGGFFSSFSSPPSSTPPPSCCAVWPLSWLTAARRWHRAKAQKEMELIRSAFLCPRNVPPQDHLPSDFRFAQYLSLRSGFMMAHMIEYGLPTWIAVELLALGFYGVMHGSNSDHAVLLWSWVGMGYTGLLLSLLLLRKLLWMRQQLTPPLPPTPFPHHLKHHTHPKQQQQQQQKQKQQQQQLEQEQLNPMLSGSAKAAAAAAAAGAEAGGTTEAATPADATTADATTEVEEAVTPSEAAAAARGGEGAAAAAACAAAVAGNEDAEEELPPPPYLLRPPPHLTRPPCSYSSRLDQLYLRLRRGLGWHAMSPHQALFWFGSKGVAFHLFFIRMLLLSQAFHVAVLATKFMEYAVDLYGDGGAVGVGLLGFTPPLLIITIIIPELIKHHVVVSSIEMMKHPETARGVVRRRKTDKALRTLLLLQKLHAFNSGARERSLSTATTSTGPLTSDRFNEEYDNFDPVRRGEVEAMFSQYDMDGSGTIDVCELTALMASVGRPVDTHHAQAMLALLDANGDGEVSRREFVVWMARQERKSRAKAGRQHEQLVLDLFAHFDLNGDGLISHEEFQQSLSGMGMSADEVAELVKELDEDGDGSVSLKEFTRLLGEYSTWL